MPALRRSLVHTTALRARIVGVLRGGGRGAGAGRALGDGAVGVGAVAVGVVAREHGRAVHFGGLVRRREGRCRGRGAVGGVFVVLVVAAS